MGIFSVNWTSNFLKRHSSCALHMTSAKLGLVQCTIWFQARFPGLLQTEVRNISKTVSQPSFVPRKAVKIHYDHVQIRSQSNHGLLHWSNWNKRVCFPARRAAEVMGRGRCSFQSISPTYQLLYLLQTQVKSHTVVEEQAPRPWDTQASVVEQKPERKHHMEEKSGKNVKLGGRNWGKRLSCLWVLRH